MGYEVRRYSYSVGPYSADWPKIYAWEAERVKGTFRSELVSLEHAGATAVPGCAGRSAVDIIAVVKNIDAVDAYEAALRAIGYEPLAYGAIVGARRFRKDVVSAHGGWECMADLFIFPEEHPVMMDMLNVRNYLLIHPDETRRYAEYKAKLFQKHPYDHLAYEEAKRAYLEKIVKKAAREAGQEEDPGSMV